MNFSDILKKRGLTENAVSVRAFIPYVQTENGPYSECYDNPLTRGELAAVFAALGLEWHWRAVTPASVIEEVAHTLAASNGHTPIVLNYCDGDEIFGEPGIAVIQQLQKNDILFTGADATFYHTSTSKIRMKEAFVRAGVPTAPFAVVYPEGDHSGLCERLGAPLILKPAVSGGSFGLSTRSVVHSDGELTEHLAALLASRYGPQLALGGLFVERYISGREFTVLVTGMPGQRDTGRVYLPVERAFSQWLPDEEQFFSYDRYWEIYKEETPLPEGETMYEYRPVAETSLEQRLAELSWQAYCAVGGTGYGRVDFRMDKESGELYVLEVNANCGISSPEDNSSVGNILKLSGVPFTHLMSDMLLGALVRNGSTPAANGAGRANVVRRGQVYVVEHD